MPELKNYRVFISHAWEYNADYHRLVKMLNEADLFNWSNYSVPEHDPLDMKGLMTALERQIDPTNIVIILSGMYAAHSDWIQKEIDIAIKKGKTIIGIAPWGQQNIPVVIQEAAEDVIRWNTTSIIDAIRKYAK